MKIKIQNKKEQQDNSYLAQILLKVVETNKNLEGTFFLEFLKHQLNCLQQVKNKQTNLLRVFRWNKSIVHWALTLQFHGGKMVIDDLRGKSNIRSRKSFFDRFLKSKEGQGTHSLIK